MLNWIFWNRTDYLQKNGFGEKKIFNGWYAIKYQPTKQPSIKQVDGLYLDLCTSLIRLA